MLITPALLNKSRVEMIKAPFYYTGLHRSVVIFIPNSDAVYTTTLIRYAPRSENHSALEVIQIVIRYVPEQCKQ